MSTCEFWLLNYSYCCSFASVGGLATFFRVLFHGNDTGLTNFEDGTRLSFVQIKNVRNVRAARANVRVSFFLRLLFPLLAGFNFFAPLLPRLH